MWVSAKLPDGHVFISAVVDAYDSTKLALRTRNEEDARRVARFFHEKAVHTPKGDYEWRVVVSKARFKRLLDAAVEEIDYRNYKKTMNGDHRRVNAHHRAWSAFLELEDVREKLKHPAIHFVPKFPFVKRNRAEPSSPGSDWPFGVPGALTQNWPDPEQQGEPELDLFADLHDPELLEHEAPGGDQGDDSHG